MPVAFNSFIFLTVKPEQTRLMVSRRLACLNDSITLRCNSGNTKPNPHLYHFYQNGLLLGKESTGNYTFDTTVKGNNTYSCVPENKAGHGNSANVTVFVKGKAL